MDHFKKTPITREQMNLTKLIKELEESMSVVKEQINTLTVETLHLKYLQMTKIKREPGTEPPTTAETSQNLHPELSLKVQPRDDHEEIEEVDEEEDDDDGDNKQASSATPKYETDTVVYM